MKTAFQTRKKAEETHSQSKNGMLLLHDHLHTTIYWFSFPEWNGCVKQHLCVCVWNGQALANLLCPPHKPVRMSITKPPLLCQKIHFLIFGGQQKLTMRIGWERLAGWIYRPISPHLFVRT